LLLLLSWRARQALPIWRDRCPEEMRNSTRLWIRRDPSLPRDSWQPFIDWGTTLKGGCRCPQLTYCQPLSNDQCWRMSTNCQAAVGSPTLQWVLQVKRPNQQHHSTEGAFNWPQRDGWLSWPCWLTDSGHFTHKVVRTITGRTNNAALSIDYWFDSNPNAATAMTWPNVDNLRHILFTSTDTRHRRGRVGHPGSCTKQTTLNVDLHLSEVNSDILHRYWTSVANLMEIWR